MNEQYKIEVNEEVIESARLAWNELSIILRHDEVVFDSSSKDDFRVFYKALVESLFEEESES